MPLIDTLITKMILKALAETMINKRKGINGHRTVKPMMNLQFIKLKVLFADCMLVRLWRRVRSTISS